MGSTVITVNAKCTTKMNVVASAVNRVVANDCTKDELDFDPVHLTGSVRDSSPGRGSNYYPPLEDICKAPPATGSPTQAPTFSPAPCCPTCASCPKCSACPGCTVNCNCGNTRGWQYECQPVTRAKVVLRRVSTLMEH